MAQMQNDQKAAPLQRIALVFLLGLGLAYWLWYGATQRSFSGDDAISALAIRGIVEHGYPLLPSGYVYHRGYVTNYLAAASVLLVGPNQFALVLPSAILAVGSLLLAYLLARDVMRRPAVGLAAVAVLLALGVQTSAATTPRMYMGLQFFTMLGLYGAWRGYVKGDARFQWIAALAVFCAFVQHEQSGALLPAIPIAVVLGRWMDGNARPRVNHVLALGKMAVLGGIYFYVTQHGLPGGPPAIAAGGAGHLQGGLTLNPLQWLDPPQWLSHAGRLEVAFPFAVPLLPLMGVVGFRAFRQRQEESNQGFLYALCVFTVCALATMFVIKYPATRFWVFVLPISVPLLLTTVAAAVGWFGQGDDSRPGRLPGARVMVLMSLALGFVPVVVGYTVVHGATGYIDVVAGGYGPPCREGGRLRQATAAACSKGVGASYANLESAIQVDDVVISSNPWVTDFYLERVNGWLREKRLRQKGEGAFAAFDSPTDEYFGIPLIDTPEELWALRGSARRVWVITDTKVERWSSSAMRDLLERHFRSYRADKYLTVYVNTPAGYGS